MFSTNSLFFLLKSPQTCSDTHMNTLSVIKFHPTIIMIPYYVFPFQSKQKESWKTGNIGQEYFSLAEGEISTEKRIGIQCTTWGQQILLQIKRLPNSVNIIFPHKVKSEADNFNSIIILIMFIFIISILFI